MYARGVSEAFSPFCRPNCQSVCRSQRRRGGVAFYSRCAVSVGADTRGAGRAATQPVDTGRCVVAGRPPLPPYSPARNCSAGEEGDYPHTSTLPPPPLPAAATGGDGQTDSGATPVRLLVAPSSLQRPFATTSHDARGYRPTRYPPSTSTVILLIIGTLPFCLFVQVPLNVLEFCFLVPLDVF